MSGRGMACERLLCKYMNKGNCISNDSTIRNTQRRCRPYLTGLWILNFQIQSWSSLQICYSFIFDRMNIAVFLQSFVIRMTKLIKLLLLVEHGLVNVNSIQCQSCPCLRLCECVQWIQNFFLSNLLPEHFGIRDA